MAFDEATAERVRKLLSGRRDVAEKKMMGSLCFMVTGHMCCSVSGRGGLLVRVGTDAYDRMLAEPNVQPMGMGRRVMTGFVRVAPEGYRTDAGLKTWVERGLAFVATMPKETVKKTKQAGPAKAPTKKQTPRRASRS